MLVLAVWAPSSPSSLLSNLKFKLLRIVGKICLTSLCSALTDSEKLWTANKIKRKKRYGKKEKNSVRSLDLFNSIYSCLRNLFSLWVRLLTNPLEAEKLQVKHNLLSEADKFTLEQLVHGAGHRIKTTPEQRRLSFKIKCLWRRWQCWRKSLFHERSWTSSRQNFRRSRAAASSRDASIPRRPWKIPPHPASSLKRISFIE